MSTTLGSRAARLQEGIPAVRALLRQWGSTREFLRFPVVSAAGLDSCSAWAYRLNSPEKSGSFCD